MFQNNWLENSFIKLPSWYASTTIVARENIRLLYITDVMIKVRYEVDTGAEISFLPEISKGRLYKSVFNLQAENGKPVAIYGKNYVYFNVGLRKSIH